MSFLVREGLLVALLDQGTLLEQSLQDMQRRGRWALDRNLRRYEQHGRLQAHGAGRDRAAAAVPGDVPLTPRRADRFKFAVRLGIETTIDIGELLHAPTPLNAHQRPIERCG